jgi:retron-type reverse transcriptase
LASTWGMRFNAKSVTYSAINLIDDYLSKRKQCVKVSTYFSTWQNIYKGVPQGSILDPVLFNVFLNNIFNFVKENKLNKKNVYLFTQVFNVEQ